MYYFMFLLLTACCLLCVTILVATWYLNPMLSLILGILAILSGSMAFWYFDNRDYVIEQKVRLMMYEIKSKEGV